MADPTFDPCPICGGEVAMNARWQAIGSAPLERVYVWVSCQGCPPCITGTCHKDEADAIEGWHKTLKQESRRR